MKSIVIYVLSGLFMRFLEAESLKSDVYEDLLVFCPK
jgi:hypothetical protein